MPTYQYRCSSCKELHEAVQRMSDPPLSTCPACGGELKRIISAAGIIFKGSGFYITDSKTGSSKSSEPEKPAEKPAATEKPAASESPAPPPSTSEPSSQKVA